MMAEIEKQSRSVKTHGGKREGAGRKMGVPNKVTIELQQAAQQFTEQALRTLVEVCENSESDAARVAAACAILDRGHGKPKQQISADMNGKLTLEQLVLGSFYSAAGA
jgi:hypothetical protein